MHADEVDIDADLVRSLLCSQFPQWARLPVQRLESGGTVNAIYRLGEQLSVRLPLTKGGDADLHHEVRWLPRFAALLPTTIPEPVAVGTPAEEYPWSWAVYRWIDGRTPVEGELVEAGRIAHDLAEFVIAMRSIDLDGGPTAHRGGPLAEVDEEVRTAIDELSRTDEPFDTTAILEAWEQSLAVPSWSGPPCWIHSDLMPSNLLVTDDRLNAVLDFGTLGVGDPASDLIPGWNLLGAEARKIFRDRVDVDTATWARGRGWALAMAVVQLPYYRRTNPVISANARFVLGQVLGDSA